VLGPVGPNESKGSAHKGRHGEKKRESKQTEVYREEVGTRIGATGREKFTGGLFLHMSRGAREEVDLGEGKMSGD